MGGWVEDGGGWAKGGRGGFNENKVNLGQTKTKA